jgi:HAMP domain-containing protein
MRIRTQLFALAVVSVFLVGAASYLGITTGRDVRDTQRQTLTDSGPVIQHLENIKFSGLHIVSSATGYGLLRLEDPVRNAARMRDEELEIIEATRDFDDSLQRIRTIWKRAGWDSAAVEEIDRAGARIKTLGLGIRSDGGRGPSVLQRKEAFDDAERSFISVVDRVTTERRQSLLTQNAQMVAATNRAFNVSTAGLIACSLFILAGALAMGHSIALPIRVLRRAAVNIGHGDWNTVVPIHARYEFGELAQSLNLMAEGL